MRIRQGKPADVRRAYRLWSDAVDKTHAFLSAQHRAEIDRLVADQFLPSADLILAVDDEDRMLGFMVMDGDLIDALFVDPSLHGQGIGTFLLDHASKLAPCLKVDASEQASNALPFYLSRGFRIVGRSETDQQGRPYPLIHLIR